MHDCGGGIVGGSAAAKRASLRVRRLLGLRSKAAAISWRALTSLIILSAVDSIAFAQEPSNRGECALISRLLGGNGRSDLGEPNSAGQTVSGQETQSSEVMKTGVTKAGKTELEQARPAEQTTPPEPTRPPEQTQPEQTKPAEQINPSMAEQAANAAAKSVELFNLLEKKSIVFPDIASTTVALSPPEKFELFVDNTISVHSVVWAALGSLIGQAADSPTGFGVGGSGYPKRLGSSLARQASGEFFGTFVLASALHEDPRFFPEYNPTLKHSIRYSLRRVFVTRNDAGESVANVSGLVGPLLGEALANAYWPDRNRTVGDTMFRYGLDLASRAGGNMFRNYWPVVFAKIRHVQPERGASN